LKGRVLEKIEDYVLIQCDVFDVELVALSRGNVKVGDKVLIVLRPDDVVVHERVYSDKAKNSMKAAVESVQISKCNVKIKLIIHDNIVMNAEISEGYIITIITILGRIREGSEVQVHVPPNCINVCKL